MEENPEKTLGQTCFEAYKASEIDQCGNAVYEQCKFTWEALLDESRESWEIAARAVADILI